MHGIPVACVSEYKVWVLLHEPKHCIFISGTFVIKWFSHNRFEITDDPFSSQDFFRFQNTVAQQQWQIEMDADQKMDANSPVRPTGGWDL